MTHWNTAPNKPKPWYKAQVPFTVVQLTALAFGIVFALIAAIGLAQEAKAKYIVDADWACQIGADCD